MEPTAFDVAIQVVSCQREVGIEFEQRTYNDSNAAKSCIAR